MAGVITTGSFAKLLWPGIRKVYGVSYDEYPVEYAKIFDKVSSEKAWEEYLGFSGFGLAQVKDENAPIKFDSAQQGFVTRGVNVALATGFQITREMFKDDLYGVIGSKKARALAFSMRQTKEVLGAALFNGGFDVGTTGDGAYIFSASHLYKAGGTWGNMPSTAVPLSELALEQAFIDIEDFRDDRGNRISISPQMLIIPKELRFEAKRILGGEAQAYTADRNINALRSLGLFDNVEINHFLTSTTAWFIKTNVGKQTGEGLVYQEREADDFYASDDPDTLNAKFTAYGRYCFLVTDPRSVYGSAGT